MKQQLSLAVALLSLVVGVSCLDPAGYQLHLVANTAGDIARYCRSADAGGYTYITCDSAAPSSWSSISITAYNLSDTSFNAVATGQEFSLGLRPSNTLMSPRISGYTGAVVASSSIRDPFKFPPPVPFTAHPFVFELVPGGSGLGIGFQSFGSLLLLLKVKGVTWLPSNRVADAYCTVRDLSAPYDAKVSPLKSLLVCDPDLLPEDALRFSIKPAGLVAPKAMGLFSRKTKQTCGFGSTGLVDCNAAGGYSACCAGGNNGAQPSGWTFVYKPNVGPPLTRSAQFSVQAWNPQLRVPIKYWVVDRNNGRLTAVDAFPSIEVTDMSYFTMRPASSLLSVLLNPNMAVVPGTPVFLFSEDLQLYCHPSTLNTQIVVCDGKLLAVAQDPERYTFTYDELACPASGIMCSAFKK